MANDYRASITRLRDRLDGPDEISDADAEALARYSAELDAATLYDLGIDPDVVARAVRVADNW